MSGKNSLHEAENRIFRMVQSNPMPLPEEHSAVFEEVQPFNQVWLWALMGGEVLLVLLPLVLMKIAFPVILMAALFMLIPLIVLGSLKLKTRLDHTGVHFQMTPFHWKVRTIPWTEIDQVYVREYSPIREYGGWGLRRGRNGWAYNVRGNYGIQVIKKNGKQIMLGTQQPGEVMSILEKHPLLSGQ